MKTFKISSRIFTLLLFVSFLSISLDGKAQIMQSEGDYGEGLIAGEIAASGHWGWFVAGCLTMGAAVVPAYLVVPSPPAHAMIGKSVEYILGYTEGYKRKSGIKNLTYSAAGCAAFWAGYVVILAGAMSQGVY